MARLSELAHARRTSPRLVELLAQCRPLEDGEDVRGSAVRRMRRRVERAARVPGSLVAETKAHFARTYAAWAEARPKDDFATMRPLLERTLELSKRLADAYGFEDHPLDALIEESDEGMRVATLTPLFSELAAALAPLVEELAAREAVELPKHRVPVERQLAFARELANELGYDTQRGRVDLTHHPFMIRLSPDDVRVTTRVREDDVTEVLYSTVHEVGHALYELGIDRGLEGTALFEGASSGVHESQSRFLENVVGRSRAFARFLAPKLAALAPELDDLDPEVLFRSVNRVERSFIRTDADEVTYNLHVLVRFALERALFDGTVAVRDLPDAWDEQMQARVGVRPPRLAQGVLQDVHWFGGPIGGAFQGYALGNLLAAQLGEVLTMERPLLAEEIASGQFDGVRAFLGERVHRHGARYTPRELVVHATGTPLSVAPLVRYLRAKHGLADAPHGRAAGADA